MRIGPRAAVAALAAAAWLAAPPAAGAQERTPGAGAEAGVGPTAGARPGADRFGGRAGAGIPLVERVAGEVRRRVLESEDPGIPVGDGAARAGEALRSFYAGRGSRPAWVGERGPFRLADELVATLGLAHQDGLRPAEYRLSEIVPRLQAARAAAERGEPPDPVALADLELLLSDAFLVYGSHLLSGRVDPERIDPEWVAHRRAADLAAVLDTAMLTGRVDGTLSGLLPPQPGYWALREALARYRGIADAGGWPAIPEGPPLRLGDRDPRITHLRLRLEATGDLAYDLSADATRFDEAVDAALRRFQTRHGLDADGVVGPGTREALSVPVETRLHQIELNMERFRWLPQDLGSRHVAVNIADFRLQLVENARPILDMRVVVGRAYRRTPVFSDRMTYLVFHPRWEVPHNIALQDVLPAVRRDPGHLAAQRMRVYRGWGDSAVEVDPAAIDWKRLPAGSFPYRLTQEPGPLNALGRVKFMFPNRFNVYLHDTPARELFERTRRDFSSGCIRVERPIELAIELLAGDPRWDRAAIERALAAGQERIVPLPRSVPVHLLYWTAWAEEDGTLHFRRDVYERDERLDRAFHAEPAGAGTQGTGI